MRTKLLLTFILLAFALGASTARSAEMPLEQQAPLPVGTVITTQNWQQYKDYMPGWMQVLFSGEYFYKLAPNQQIVVGPTIPKTLPKAYLANTEKYSGQVTLKELPEGATLIQNYTAGLPFPHPTQPDLGAKLVWNLWYRYQPRVENFGPRISLIDQYHAVYKETLVDDIQRLGHVSEPGLPIYTPQAPNLELAYYNEITAPEGSKYTVALILFFLDPTRVQETWTFVPSLRRPLRLSASARCSPSVGSDGTLEENRAGFNLLVSDMVAQPVAHKMTLMMNHVEPQYPAPIDLFDDPNTIHQWGLDQGVPWPPAPNKWELEETYIVDLKRVPSKLAGYCYGNRRINIDAVDYHQSGEELSDMGGKLWKLFFQNQREHPNGYGDLYETGASQYLATIVDLQNRHYTVSEQFNGQANTDAAKEYWDVVRYASPTGLLEIMK